MCTVAPYPSQQHESLLSTPGNSEHHTPAQVITGPRRGAVPLRNLWAGARGTAWQILLPVAAVGPWVLGTLQSWTLSTHGHGRCVVMMLLWTHFWLPDMTALNALGCFPTDLLFLSTKKKTRRRSVISVAHAVISTTLASSLTQTHLLHDCLYSRNICNSAESTHSITLQNTVIFADTEGLFHFTSLISLPPS